MTASTPAIEVEHLQKTYPKGVQAVRDVSFRVEPGQIFGLLGPNGAGKSTTVRILATLTTASGGRACVGGCDVARNPQGVRRSIGYVGQRLATDEESTGRENLLLQGHLYGLSGSTLAERVKYLLEHFGLQTAAHRLARTYSGGMRRRLDIAMGLVHRPKVLILDEPTTGLDPESRATLWHVLAQLRSEQNLAVLLTTHYLDEADRLADRIAIIDRGEVVALDTPQHLKDAIHGDVVELEFSGEAEAASAEAALTLPAIRATKRGGKVLHLQVENGSEAVPVVAAALTARGISTRTIAVHRPSLDDVYFHFTGRSFTDSSKEASSFAGKWEGGSA